MTRIFANANYDFIGFRRKAILATITLFVVGVIALFARGLNYSIEFTGGTLVDFRSNVADRNRGAPLGADQRTASTQPEITPFGGSNEWNVRARVGHSAAAAGDTAASTNAVKLALNQVIGASNYTVRSSQAVGPEGGPRSPHQGLPGHLPVVLRGARVPGVPVRVAVRAGGRCGHVPRHRADHLLHRRHEDRDFAGGGGGGALDGGVFAERHHRHLRPGAREPPQESPRSPGRHSQPIGERDAAAVGADPYDGAGDADLAARSSAGRSSGRLPR